MFKKTQPYSDRRSEGNNTTNAVITGAVIGLVLSGLLVIDLIPQQMPPEITTIESKEFSPAHGLMVIWPEDYVILFKVKGQNGWAKVDEPTFNRAKIGDRIRVTYITSLLAGQYEDGKIEFLPK